MPNFLATIIDLQLYLFIFFGALYLLIVFWVAKDIAQRSTSLLMQSFSIIITVAFPAIGLMTYLLIRPELLIHKEIREFLYAQTSK